MGCGCGGAKSLSIAYKIIVPGQDVTYAETVGEARIVRQSTSLATVIQQVPRSEYDEWQARQDTAPVALTEQ